MPDRSARVTQGQPGRQACRPVRQREGPGRCCKGRQAGMRGEARADRHARRDEVMPGSQAGSARPSRCSDTMPGRKAWRGKARPSRLGGRQSGAARHASAAL
jgi:hypothetical protein